MKLRTKIAVTVNLFSIGTLICTAGIVIYLFSQRLITQKENDAIALAQLVALNADVVQTLEQTRDFQLLLNRLVSNRSDLLAIDRVDANYKIMISSGEKPSLEERKEKEIKEITQQAVQENRAASSWEGDLLIVVVPTTKRAVGDGEPTPTGAVLVYLSLAELWQAIGQAVLFSFILCVVVVLLGTAFYGFFITRLLLRPIEAMISLARQIAGGDLSHHIETRRQDELGYLEEALGQMSDNLRTTIGHIQQAALRISTSSEQIAATLQQQAAISSQQAAATSQTTTATEELAATARQIAEGAEQVVQLATSNQEEAQRGVQAVSETVEKMDEIERGNQASLQEITSLSDRSRRIGEVMSFIRNITDQTRIIAFNAAIEAAAAGEIGRRFSVVATQVRGLAGDVSQATEEIGERIEEIQVAANELAIASEQRGKRVAEGAEQTEVTAKVLEEMLERANDVTEVAWQISLGTRQQHTAAEQAVEALREIAAGAKQVEEGSQQTAQVIADLVNLAEELREAVGHFQLPAGRTMPAPEGSDARDRGGRNA